MMEFPGLKNLGSAGITAAVTNQVLTSLSNLQGETVGYADRLDGMLAATLEARFVYGGGGTTAVVLVQTTLDLVNWLDVARFDFEQANAVKIANLSGLTAKAAAAYAALDSEGVNDGLFGPRWRALLTTTGIYTNNTSVAVRMNAR